MILKALHGYRSVILLCLFHQKWKTDPGVIEYRKIVLRTIEAKERVWEEDLLEC